MVWVHEGELSAEIENTGGQMPVREAGGYYVGQDGWIDVLDSAGKRRFRVEGEIVSLLPTSDNILWALIKTRMGTGVYRLW